jgi:hypothetical protein
MACGGSPQGAFWEVASARRRKGFRVTFLALSGSLARRPADSSRSAGATGAAVLPAGPPCAREAKGTRCKPWGAAGAGWPGRELVFPGPRTKVFFGNSKRAPEPAGPGPGPKQGPRVCKKGAPEGARGRLSGNPAPKRRKGAVAASL